MHLVLVYDTYKWQKMRRKYGYDVIKSHAYGCNTVFTQLWKWMQVLLLIPTYNLQIH